MTTAPRGSQRFRFLFADEASIYGILPTGELMWFPHWDDPASAPPAISGRQIGVGWSDIRHVFAGGGGVIYVTSASGELRWYKDFLRDGSNAPDGSTGWESRSGSVIGTGWNHAARVFSGGDGVIYAMAITGQHLLWYRDERQDGTIGWAPRSGSPIGQGWSGFRHILSGGGGVIYVVDDAGHLKWYRDDRLDGSNSADGSTGWAANSGAVIGTGWRFLSHVFAGGAGQIFACQSLSEKGGYLRQYIDLRRDGSAHWRTIADAVKQFGSDKTGSYSAGWIIAPIEGYAWPLSVGPGGTVDFHVSTGAPDGCVAEPVRLTGQGPVLGTPIPKPPVAVFQSSFQPDNGAGADCRWPVTFSFTAPTGTAAWQPGFYAARVGGQTGQDYDIPFVVGRGATPAQLAVIVNVNTWNAYNPWGGESNYSGNAGLTDLTHKRPGHHLLTSSQDSKNGNGNLRSEIWLVDWLQTRHAVDLITDLELHAQPNLSGYKAILIGSHPEYWTAEMIAAITGYLDGGGSLLYIGANGMYRPTYLRAETPGGDIDLMTTFYGPQDTYPLYEDKPLFCAAVQTVTNPLHAGVGFTIHAGQPFVPPGFPPFIAPGVQTVEVGTTGWNPFWIDDTAPASQPWGAAGLEIDVWPGPLPEGISEIGRSATDAVIATYRTRAGGFVFGAGSISFVGALAVDPILQAIVENALTDALSR